MLPHLCTNADKGEKSMRRNVHATKCPCDEMSMRRNVRDEVSVRRSVRHSLEIQSTPLNRATSGPGYFDPIKRRNLLPENMQF